MNRHEKGPKIDRKEGDMIAGVEIERVSTNEQGFTVVELAAAPVNLTDPEAIAAAIGRVTSDNKVGKFRSNGIHVTPKPSRNKHPGSFKRSR